ncbi:MAG: di-heme oxidoredictase family protein [Acidobacteriota bacterium]
MKTLKISALLLFAAALVLPFTFTSTVEGQAATAALETQMDARLPDTDLFNNFGTLGNPIDECTNPPVASRSFRDNKAIFEEREVVDDGLGPTYNAEACSTCHQAPVTGHVSQVNEFRVGSTDIFGNFVAPPGGQTLIQDRAIDAEAQEHINTGLNLHEFRSTRTVLGDGFVEAINSNTLVATVAAQPAAQRGQLRTVAVLEAPGQNRTGRFGHKSQHASLVSFSADAYLNEMGITSDLLPNENNILGASAAPFDTVADPEDAGNEDVEAFAAFMRALRVPGRGPINSTVTAGETLFSSIGCAVCHTPQFTTSATGTVINGGAFTVPAALGNKIIRPFSDFALHNIGTSAGIGGENGVNDRFATTTIALWGVRTKGRFMMQGNTMTIFDSIQVHGGQGSTSRTNFNNLSTTQKNQVIAFVLSL